MSTWTTPATWANSAVTAAQMNTEIRDHLNWLKGAFTQINVTGDAAATNLARGTSFPGSPTTSDRYFRTDRGIDYYWDGTRWLSVTLYDIAMIPDGDLPTAGAMAWRSPALAGLFEIYFVDLVGTAHVLTTNNAGNHWSLAVDKTDGVTATNLTTFTTSSGGANVWFAQTVVINALIGTAIELLSVNVTTVGSPGGLYEVLRLRYRLVG